MTRQYTYFRLLRKSGNRYIYMVKFIASIVGTDGDFLSRFYFSLPCLASLPEHIREQNH